MLRLQLRSHLLACVAGGLFFSNSLRFCQSSGSLFGRETLSSVMARRLLCGGFCKHLFFKLFLQSFPLDSLSQRRTLGSLKRLGSLQSDGFSSYPLTRLLCQSLLGIDTFHNSQARGFIG